MGTSGDGEPNGDDVTRAFAAGEVEDPVEEGRALAELENRLFGKPKDDLTISRYRLERKVAEGGFGAVYLARDPELDRPVAVKLLHGRPRSGLDDTEARARLLREAQAMASFSHPNVVAVHDVGTFDEEESTAGPPGVFIVMEYIEGPTIAQWLAAQPRHWRDVLEVFGAAGTGVAAAHAHGLVHRDFKPANVVVASDGRVRVLDFGLARAIDAGPESGRQVVASREATEDSISSSSRSGRTPSLFEGSLTITGTVMGTPAYMAPEQHAGMAANEACDQYAFCVALFEALYGKRPFSGKGSTLVEAKQNERIAEPPTDRAVPGWLFKIVRRGLSANPGARFATMEGLLAALADDPAARRRRLLFTAAGVLAVTLSAFAGYQWLDQRGRACVSDPEAFAGTWDPATKASIRKAFLATQTPFADETWNWVEPTVDDYVDRWNAVRREACEATLVDETEVMAVMGERMLCLDRRLQRVTGVTRLFVGADRAIVERAIETVAALPSPDRCLDKQSAGGTEALTKAARTVVLDSEQVMARGAAMLLAGKAGDAIPQVRTAIEEVRAVDHPPTLARMLLVLADLHESLGEVDDAHATAKEALAVAERAGAEDIALEAMVATITILTASGRHEAADPLVDMASARIARAAKGTDTEATLQLAIGLLRTDQGKFDEAIAALSRGLELRKRLLGPDNLRVAQLHSGLGRAYATSGRYAEAEQHMARSLEISRASFGDEHPVVAKDMSNHANILDLQGRYSEALENYKTALAMAKTALAPDDPAVAIIGGNVGVALDRLGRRREALVHYRNSLALQERIYGTDHPSWALPAANIAMSLTKIGDYEEAITYYRRALSAVEGSQGAESPAAANMRAGLGSSLAGLGRYEEAHSELDRALKTQRAILGPGHPELVAAIQALGEVYMLEGKPKQAIVAFDEALGQRRTAFGDDNVEIAWSYMVRAWALNALGRHDEVVDTLPKQLLRVEDLVGKESPELVEGLLELGVARVAAGATAEGVLDLERAAKICAGGEVTPLTVERVDKALARARK